MRNISFSPPDITNQEIDEVVKTLKSGWITTGPKTKQFEKELSSFIGTNRSVCLSSATAAMELTLRVLGIGPGDEVITSAYTYTASASIINHVGADIVLVDTAPNSYEMDYDELSAAITSKTKMIIPVDIAGRMCDYDKLFKVLKSKKHLFKPDNRYQDYFDRIIVMADAAHSLGAKRNGRNSGQFADFSCFSFHAVKNLTTAEGGAVTWRNDIGFDDDELYQEYMLLSLHGQSKDALSKSQKGSWEYDILYPAYKFNMTDIQASLGLVQLKRYNYLLNKRKEIIKQYDRHLNEMGIQYLEHFSDDTSSSGHLYLTRVPGIGEEERNVIIQELANNGIASNVHYKPLPMFTAYKKLGFSIKNFPNAYAMYQNEITLPLHTLMSNDDIKYVVECLDRILKKI